jgi:hypothetical protein
MTDTDQSAQGIKGDLYRGFAAEAERLEQSGHSTDTVIDAVLAMALTLAARAYGPRAVGQRLYLLAQQFAAEADRVERDEGTGGSDGRVH